MTSPSIITPAPARRRRRPRRRWVVAIVAVLLVVVVGALVAAGTASGPPPLALPSTAAAAPVGPLDGRWTVATGSVAGFRIEQTFLGMHADVVGRSGVVTGTATVVSGQVTAASFTVDLGTLIVNGKPPPQLAISLDTGAYPLATIELTPPLVLGPALASGGPASMTAKGKLTMNGVTKPVTIALSVRRDGTAVQAVGSIPVAFTDWNVQGPAGYGFFGSLADHGIAEFLLVLQQGSG